MPRQIHLIFHICILKTLKALPEFIGSTTTHRRMMQDNTEYPAIRGIIENSSLHPVAWAKKRGREMPIRFFQKSMLNFQWTLKKLFDGKSRS